MRTILFNLLILPVALLLPSAAMSADAAAQEKSGSKMTVTLGVNDIYCVDSACKCVHDVAARTYRDLQRQLADTAGIELKIIYYPDTISLEKAVIAGGLDGFICKPWLALWFGRAAGRDFQRIADIADPNNNRWLTGIAVVKADSPFKNLRELNGKNITIGQADSFEKHFAAFALFENTGVKPGKINEKSSCIENIGELIDGKCDAIVISDYAITADCAVDFAKPEDFRTIAVTEKIPLTSVMLDTKKISPEKSVKLKNALLACSGTNIPKSFLGPGFLEPSPWQPAPVTTGRKP